MILARWTLYFAFLCGALVETCRAGEAATATATVTGGYVSSIALTFPGSGYSTEPHVTIAGGGGSGATAKAILEGDQVAAIVVLTAGNGYYSAPLVTITAPPETLNLAVELVAKLRLSGISGTSATVQWASQADGPWTDWTNVTMEAKGTVLVDLTAESAQRYYRAVPLTSLPRFAWIAPGTFVMGSPTSETGRFPDEAQHMVTLTQGFWISVHEVTQSDYQSMMGDNPSFFNGSDLPVEQVTWSDATLYCQKLTEQHRLAGLITARQAYRLPTEAEWEYSARAGIKESRHGALDEIAWWGGNSLDQTHSVGQKTPNAWGLHDLLGNVSEWCSDWYDPQYPAGIVTDPIGPSAGSQRVIRGGGGNHPAWGNRSAQRFRMGPAERDRFVGFRPVLVNLF